MRTSIFNFPKHCISQNALCQAALYNVSCTVPSDAMQVHTLFWNLVPQGLRKKFSEFCIRTFHRTHTNIEHLAAFIILMLPTLQFCTSYLTIHNFNILSIVILDFILESLGARGSTVVKVLCYSGTAVAQWLRCCAINRKVSGSIPARVTDIKSFRSHYGPGVDSVSNSNEYQENFLGVKAAGA
jgi:hypothetical protein